MLEYHALIGNSSNAVVRKLPSRWKPWQRMQSVLLGDGKRMAFNGAEYICQVDL